MTFVEQCGSYNIKMDIIKPGEQEKNQFFGIPCICNPGSESTWDHMGMVGEAGMVDFIIHNIFSQPRSVSCASVLDSKPDNQLKAFAQNCDLLETFHPS